MNKSPIEKFVIDNFDTIKKLCFSDYFPKIFNQQLVSFSATKKFILRIQDKNIKLFIIWCPKTRAEGLELSEEIKILSLIIDAKPNVSQHKLVTVYSQCTRDIEFPDEYFEPVIKYLNTIISDYYSIYTSKKRDEEIVSELLRSESKKRQEELGKEIFDAYNELINTN